MGLFPWLASESIAFKAGRLTMGVVYDRERKHPGDVLVRAGDIGCVIDGRIIRARNSAGSKAPSLTSGSYAEAVIAMYQRYGEDFASVLEGQFTVVLFDARKEKLIICTSRTAFTPLYEYHANDMHLYCSQLGPMAKSGHFDAEPDVDAIGTMLAYGELFEQETLVKHVSAIEPASIQVVSTQDGSMSKHRYWDYRRHGPIAPNKSMREYGDILCDVLSSAADRRTRTDIRAFTSLSGGYDSRLVSGLMAGKIPELGAWTFGMEGDPDLPSAREVASRANLRPHLIYGVFPETIPEYAEDFVSSVDACNTTNWAFAKSRKEDLRKHADIVFNGFGGDAYLGGSMAGGKYRTTKAWIINRAQLRQDAPAPILEWNHGPDEFARFVAFGNKISDTTGRDPWFQAPSCSLQDRAYEEFSQSFGDVPEWYLAEQWLLENRTQRFTLMSIISDRFYFEDDSLFYDYDVLDYCGSVPPRMRRGHRLYIQIIKRLIPNLAPIANSTTGLAATMPPALVTAHKIGSRLLQYSVSHKSSHVLGYRNAGCGCLGEIKPEAVLR
jgi:asparagine synthetase B (glutamine-hydrolysing)